MATPSPQCTDPVPPNVKLVVQPLAVSLGVGPRPLGVEAGAVRVIDHFVAHGVPVSASTRSTSGIEVMVEEFVVADSRQIVKARA